MRSTPFIAEKYIARAEADEERGQCLPRETTDIGAGHFEFDLNQAPA